MLGQLFLAITSVIIFTVYASDAFAAEAIPAKLLAQTHVSQADASATALSKVPAGTITGTELEEEKGKLIWSFDIAKASSKEITEIQVDAKSGCQRGRGGDSSI